MPLSNEDISNRLSDLPGWEKTDHHIRKIFTFDDFTEALDFVVHIGQLADEQDHHPDIDIRFNKVTLELMTHSENGVTDKDIKLAKAIEDISL